MARQDHTPVTDEQKQQFLDELAGGASIIDAAGNESLRRKLYRLKEADAAFAAEWALAYKEGTDALTREARRRAVEGVAEPRMIGHGDSAQLITVKRYSDPLLMFLIKQRDPSYRDRVQVEGSADAPPVQVEVKHSVDDLAAVASILAGAGVLDPGSGAHS